MRKITYLAVSLMALMAVSGFIYAYWTDQLVIEGEINTGTIGWELSYKGVELAGHIKEDEELVWAGAALKDDDGDTIFKKLRFEVDNLYPGVRFELEWDIHYYGTVPGHLTDIDVEVVVDYADGSQDVFTGVSNIPDWLYIYTRARTGWVYEGLAPEDVVERIGTGDTFLSLPGLIDLLTASGPTQWHQSNEMGFTFWIALVEPPNGDIPGMFTFGNEPIIVNDGEPPQGARIGLTLTIEGQQYNAGLGVKLPPPP